MHVFIMAPVKHNKGIFFPVDELETGKLRKNKYFSEFDHGDAMKPSLELLQNFSFGAGLKWSASIKTWVNEGTVVN